MNPGSKAPFEDETPLRFEQERWRAQSGPDPRSGARKHRARLSLYDDAETLSTAELGTRLEAFLEPEGQ